MATILTRPAQIFEIEEDSNGSIMEHREPSDFARQRKLSQFSHRRPSGGSEGHHSAHSHQSLQPPASPAAIPLSRPRLNTLLHKGVEMAQNVVASPLAQIFQPLIVDDDIPEEPEDEQNSAGNFVSYGPASRRRLLSMNQRRPVEMAAQAMRWGPTSVAHKLLGEHPLSQSPEQNQLEQQAERDEEDPQPETVTQVEDEEQSGGGEPRLMRKLHLMEERQKRIEDLLLQLNDKIDSKDSK